MMMPTPTNIEKLFVGIFDRKRRIIEKLNHQKQLYDQRLVSKLLIDGITPPPWLIQSGVIPHNSSNSDPKELNKEELISGLLLSHQHSPVPHRNSTGFFYHRTASLDADGKKPVDFCYGTSASSKYSNGNEPGIHPQMRGISTMHTLDDIPASPQDLVDAKEPDICNEAEQSLVRITRSRSRQKALELRPSAKASDKSHLAQESGLELCFDDTACQLDGERLNECSGQDKPNDIPASPQDLKYAKELDICNEADKSLVKITRSRSRQKALELRNSAKATGKSLLAQESSIGICFDDTPCHEEQVKSGDMENRFDVHSDSISRLRDDVTQKTMHYHQDKGDKEIVYSGRMTRSRSNIQHSIDGNHWITQVQNEVNNGGATKCRSCDAKLEEIEGPIHKKRKAEHQILNRKCHSLILEAKPFHKTSEDTPNRSSGGSEGHYALLQKRCTPQNLGDGHSGVSSSVLPKHAPKRPYLESEVILEHRSGSIPPASDEQVNLSSIPCFNSEMAVDPQSHLSEVGKLRTDSAVGVVSTDLECDGLFLPEDNTEGSVSEKMPSTRVNLRKSLMEEEGLNKLVSPLQFQVDVVDQDEMAPAYRGLDVYELRKPVNASSEPNVLLEHIDATGTPAVDGSANSKWAEPKDPQSNGRKVEGIPSNSMHASPVLNSNYSPYFTEGNSGRLAGHGGDSSFQKQFIPSPGLGALASSPSYIAEMENLAKGSMIRIPESGDARQSLQCVADSAHRSGGMIPSTCEHDNFVLSSISYTSQQISVDSQGQSLSGIRKVGTDPINSLGSPEMQCDDSLCVDKVETSAEKLGTSDVFYMRQQISVDSQGQSLSGLGKVRTDPSNSLRSLGIPCDDMSCGDQIETGVEKLGTSDVTLLSDGGRATKASNCDAKQDEAEDSQCMRRKTGHQMNRNHSSLTLKVRSFQETSQDSSNRSSGGLEAHYGSSQKHFTPRCSGLGQSSPSNIFMKEIHRNVKSSLTILPKSAPDSLCLESEAILEYRSAFSCPASEHEQVHPPSSSCLFSEMAVDPQRHFSEKGKIRTDPAVGVISTGMERDGLFPSKDETDDNASEKVASSEKTVGKCSQEAELDHSLASLQVQVVDVVEQDDLCPAYRGFEVYEPTPSLPNVVLEHSDVTGTHALNGSPNSIREEPEDPQSKRRKVEGLPFNSKPATPVLGSNSSSYFIEDSSGRLMGFGDDSKLFTSSRGSGALASSARCIAEMEKLLNDQGSGLTMLQSATEIHYPKGIVDSGHKSGGMISPTCELENFMFSSMSGLSQQISVDSQGQSPSGVGKDPSNVPVSSGMQCDDLLCEEKAETDAEMMHTSDATLIPVEPLQKEASVDCSVAASDTLHLHVVGNEETMPVLHRFIVDDQENVKEFFEHCNSTGLSTPLSQLPKPFKDKLAAGVSHSVPNGHMEHIEGINTLNDKVGSALGGKSYSECFLFPSARFDWDFSKPYMSPIGKGFEGLTSSSGGSDKLGNSNPELTCFPIEEDPEISDEVFNADEVSEACDVVDCSGVGKKIREPFRDITVENASALASDIVARRESLESVSTEINVIETHKNLGNKERKSRDKKPGKENSSLSLGDNSVKKHTGSIKTRSSKPKLSEKASLRMRDQSFTEKEPKHNNIVSNVKSFIPLVQKNQAAAVPGKRDVKVKALEAAEAAKRLAEKRENERKQKKEASKLERARIQQENLKRLELERKSKEEEQKKKEAAATTRKRQREEEERKERERKRKRLEEARKQQREQGAKSHSEKEQSRLGKAEVMDIDTVEISTPIRDEDNNSVILEVKEQSYDISPYQCSDGEEDEEEEDDHENRKFVPAWASKNCVALAISSQKQDPDSIFPPGSFRSLDEVLMPRRLQRKS